MALVLSESSDYDDTMDDGGGNEWSDDEQTPQGAGSNQGQRPSTATVQAHTTQLRALLGTTDLWRLLASHTSLGSGGGVDEDDEIEDGYGGLGSRHRRRPRGGKVEYPPVPSEEGRTLMGSGLFGSNENDVERKSKKSLSRKLLSRELGADPLRLNGLISQGLIPSSKADLIIHHSARCYSGQFSDDGNFFFSCAQDFRVRMYDTSNPYKWKYYKSVVYQFGQWTITDASLSPDNQFLAYSSIRNIVCLAPTDPAKRVDPLMLDFSYVGSRSARRRFHGGHSNFGIWSIRFSGDGRELVAGTSDHSVYVYDIESQQPVLRIPGHNDDVNAVCFADGSSPHILYSGSDDTLIKVWDRRSMRHNREAGVFVGHTQGLTYVDSKGDGRYLLSNGKDQTMKLWDLRKMLSSEDTAGWDPTSFQTKTGFDYRFMAYSDSDYKPHPHDCSVVTYRGHRVLKTLIRCHFSPPTSSNERYVYSGSEDGSVYIYNMDATLAGKVDVKAATHNSRPRDTYDTTPYETGNRGGGWKTCVRDASWQPNAPVIAATAWNGWGMSTGTCTIHSWHGGVEDDDEESPRVDEQLKYDDDLYDNTAFSDQVFGTPAPRRSSRLRARR